MIFFGGLVWGVEVVIVVLVEVVREFIVLWLVYLLWSFYGGVGRSVVLYKDGFGVVFCGWRLFCIKRVVCCFVLFLSLVFGFVVLGRWCWEVEVLFYVVYVCWCCVGRVYIVVFVGLELSYIVSCFVFKWSEGFKMYVFFFFL